MVVNWVASTTLLSLSSSTTFISAVSRLLRWRDTMKPDNVPTRLVMCLAFSDCFGSLAWALSHYTPLNVSCPGLMSLIYIGFLSSCLFTNCIGIYLVTVINRRKIPEKYYYIISWGVPVVMFIVLLFIPGSYWISSEMNLCWWNLMYDVVFWRTFQYITFFVNLYPTRNETNRRKRRKKKTNNISLFSFGIFLIFIFDLFHVLFGYVTQKIVASRKAWKQNEGMRDKEKRLYLLIICFFVPTCGGVLYIIPTQLDNGVYLISCQGVLNAIAMNEKFIHRTLLKLYHQRCGVYHSEALIKMDGSVQATPPPSPPLQQSADLQLPYTLPLPSELSLQATTRYPSSPFTQTDTPSKTSSSLPTVTPTTTPHK